jgi:hypothetical protein
VNEECGNTHNPDTSSPTKIIIWEKEIGEYRKMSLSGLRDFAEGRMI